MIHLGRCLIYLSIYYSCLNNLFLLLTVHKTVQNLQMFLCRDVLSQQFLGSGHFRVAKKIYPRVGSGQHTT